MERLNIIENQAKTVFLETIPEIQMVINIWNNPNTNNANNQVNELKQSTTFFLHQIDKNKNINKVYENVGKWAGSNYAGMSAQLGVALEYNSDIFYSP